MNRLRFRYHAPAGPKRPALQRFGPGFLAVVVFLHTFGSVASSQAPAVAQKTETSTIRGRVIASDTGRGVTGAHVSLTGNPNPSTTNRTAVSGDDGRFELTGIAPGRYMVMVRRTGYPTVWYGQRTLRDAPRFVDLTRPQVVEGLDFSVPAASVVTVRITDDLGEPLPGIYANLVRFPYVKEQSPLLVSSSIGRLAVTDDAGELRLIDVPPGEYYVRASPSMTYRGLSIGSTGSRRTFSHTFYPGTTSFAEASPISVGGGQEYPVAFSLAVVPVANVAGIVVTSEGQAAHAVIELAPSKDVEVSGQGMLALHTQTDGSFRFPDVPPGEYALIVTPSQRTRVAPSLVPVPSSNSVDAFTPVTGERAYVPVTVAGVDLTGLVIRTSRGSMLRGRFVFNDEEPPRYSRDALRLAATSREILHSGVHTTNPDWTFELADVVGKGVLRLRSASWYIKAVIINGADVTETALDFNQRTLFDNVEIVVTQRRAAVEGAVTDSRNRPADAAVVIFAEDPNLWTPDSQFSGTARPDQNGRYRVGSLPAGRYLAAAVEYLEAGQERSFDVLKQLAPLATRVSVGEGEIRTLNLRVVEMKP
jgi:hypothetical protein